MGPEILEEATRVLNAVAQKYGRTFEYQSCPIGGIAIDEYGDPLPEVTLQAFESADAILLAAVGGPKWDKETAARRPETGLLRMRKALGAYANIRPVAVNQSLVDSSTLRPEVLEGADMVIVRELTGGLYFGDKGRKQTGTPEEQAFDTLIYSRSEIERIVRVAFDLAKGRRRKVTSVDKANVLESSRLWREVVEQVAADYPEIQYEHALVDSCAMQLIRNPRQYDVVVTENMFGDILSDEAAMLTGSIGMLPSASLGNRVALYEPIHGSAPDIAGKGIANPSGIILSVAMMLRHSFGYEAEAAAVESAVGKVIEQGYRTADICRPQDKRVSTSEFGSRVVEALRA
ncbi:MAG: 3-isopropylmalate dehydrogenase [Bacilli bacterium]|nr:3-isopropylmalate dehydrogenase [Bacilli bacterium]